MKLRTLWITAAVAVVALASVATAQMNEPEMVTLSGTVIDLTCAAKGQAMMANWHNAEHDDHMTPDGEKKACATMCLKGGQPAALFTGDRIEAVFACNPRATLADFAAEEVDVQGFWAGSSDDATRTFVPAKIRAAGSSSWQSVDCATMHS